MDRKALKQAGKKSFHRHYLILIFLCIIMALFGTEGGRSVQLLKIQTKPKTEEGTQTILRAQDVYQSILEGNFLKGELMSDIIEENIPVNLEGSSALGTQSGVLAGLVNSVMSGRFYVNVAKQLYDITGSASTAALLFSLLDLLFYALLWFFFRNVFSAALRRMFLEARTYEKVPFLDILHVVAVRKWLHACLTMFVKTLFLVLWSLTIVGGFIKYYSYYLVPYIVAENPGISPLKAITLSRKMMDGHKKEAFVFDLSFIGWYLLAIVTFGLSDAFYGFPYRIAARTEYYVYLRTLAREAGLEGSEELNDTCLYEKADRITLYETYFDVVDMQTLVVEKKVSLHPIQQFLVKWLGLWFGGLEKKKLYDDAEALKYSLVRGKRCRDGLAYPLRLNPSWKSPKRKLTVPFSFMRSYSVWTMILLFILFCVIGWIWEVSLHYGQTGEFVNRGVLHGPWLPIYGCGGIVALSLCSRLRKNPVAEFFFAVALCGTIEYLAAYILETKYHERWWSYDGCFLNIQGRVCAEGLIVFGIACMLVVYLIAPLFDFLLSRLPNRLLIGLAAVLMTVFLIDAVYSGAHPNVVPGAVETKETEAAAEETGSSAEEETEAAAAVPDTGPPSSMAM